MQGSSIRVPAWGPNAGTAAPGKRHGRQDKGHHSVPRRTLRTQVHQFPWRGRQHLVSAHGGGTQQDMAVRPRVACPERAGQAASPHQCEFPSKAIRTKFVWAEAAVSTGDVAARRGGVRLSAVEKTEEVDTQSQPTGSSSQPVVGRSKGH